MFDEIFKLKTVDLMGGAGISQTAYIFGKLKIYCDETDVDTSSPVKRDKYIFKEYFFLYSMGSTRFLKVF